MPSITLTDPTTLTVVASGLIATNNSNLRTLLNAGLDGANFKGNPSLASGEVPVWNGSSFDRSTVTRIGVTSLGSGTANSSVFLRGDGAWAAPSGAGIPPGAVIQYGAASAPSGWVLCDGASLLRTAPNDALFAIIGTIYGSIDGTHFNVPDFRGRVPTGYAASGGHTDVATLGLNDGVAVANRRSKHRHSPHSHSYTGAGSNVASSSAANLPVPNTGNTTGTADGGSGNANDSLDAPAYLVINYIIKL